MSADSVNYALTNVSQRIGETHRDCYSPDGRARLLYMIGCMRDHLMRESIEGFDNYVDNALASSPDATDLLLEELFEELSITDREQLSAKLAE